MKRTVFGLVLGVSAFAGITCGGSNPTSGTLQPYRDDWEVAFEGPFPYLVDGMPQITTLTVGGQEFRENFANRGDVIVRFADVNTIKVEIRRFTTASSLEAAQLDFLALEPWAFTVGPASPDGLDEEDNCMAVRGNGQPRPWQDGCTILVYYRGLTQLARAGADLRVTLPSTYRHRLDINTEDNDEDTDYLNRGNVCVENLNATAEITLGSASAYVIVAPDATPMPVCRPEGIAACEAAQWAEGCECDQLGTFGSVRIDGVGLSASDMYVDIPAGLWAAPNLDNQSTAQMLNPPGDAPGARCDSTVCFPPDVYELDEAVVGTEENRDPWRNKGSINLPGPDAAKSGGFRIALTSPDCAPVPFTENPEDYVGEGNALDQPLGERGNMQVCAGCLRAQSCEQLLADLPTFTSCG